MDLQGSSSTNQLATAKRSLVLAVDDHEDSLLLVTYALELFKCSCVSAVDGQTALSLAIEYQPDLILLDVLLPDLNGIQVIHSLKQNPRTRVIPIVAVTALVSLPDRERLLRAGCDDYLGKPYLLDDLETVLQRHLRLSLLA